AQKNSVRIAAVFSDVAHRPRECRRGVLDLRRVRVFRSEPVTGYDGEDACPGKAITERRIESAIAEAPRAPVDEEQDRHTRWFLWPIKVQLVFGVVFGFARGIDQVLLDFDVGSFGGVGQAHGE